MNLHCRIFCINLFKIFILVDKTLTMGKNKGKGGGKRKDKSVFKVAGSKVTKKGKAKPVTTDLKRVR